MLSFGLADFIAKNLLAKTNAYQTLLISQAIGTVPFLIVAFALDFGIPDPSLLLLAIFSGAVSAVYMLLFYTALRLGKAMLVSPIASCLSVFAVVLSAVILGERLTGAQLFLVLAVLVGIVSIALQRNTNEERSGSYLSIPLAVLAAFLGGGNAILQKWISVADHNLLNFAVVRLSMIGSITLLLPLAGYRTVALEKSARKGKYVALALLGLLDAFGFFAYFMGFRAGLVSIVAPIAGSSAIVTTLLARLFLGERIRIHQGIGVITILASITLLSAVS